MDADVIVIGAGPAGCAAAIRLVSAGYEVTVLERKEREDGEDITSGEALLPRTPEMETDGLTELDVAESIVNAVAIYKRLRSRSPRRPRRVEYLYVIQATNLEGIMIYSKGKLVSQGAEVTFYFLVSSKRAF